MSLNKPCTYTYSAHVNYNIILIAFINVLCEITTAKVVQFCFLSVNSIVDIVKVVRYAHIFNKGLNTFTTSITTNRTS